MTRADYLATLLLLIRMLDGTVLRDHDTRANNFALLVNTIELFLDCATVDGDNTPLRTMSTLYLDRIRRVRGWTHHELCQEWTATLLAVA